MKDKKTTISFTYEGKDYKLEFTAHSLKTMEKQGFRFAKMDDFALTAPEELFCGAFIANHDSVPKKKRLAIYKELMESAEDNEDATLTTILGDMMAEALEELNSHTGKVAWRVEQ